MTGYRQVATTVGSEAAAEELAQGIVGARLGACVHIVGPIRSVYRWQGEVHSDQEWQCQVKTTAERVDELIAHIRANHAYDIPEVVITSIEAGDPDYLAWISEQTRA